MFKTGLTGQVKKRQGINFDPNGVVSLGILLVAGVYEWLRRRTLCIFPVSWVYNILLFFHVI